MSEPDFSIPLSPLDKQIRKHALLCSIGFIFLLPVGVLIGRYFRTFTSKWFWAHSFLQFIVSGPVIFAGWYYGYQSTASLNTGGHFVDPHKKTGLALLILYLVQLLIGTVIHSFKTPRLLNGHRPPQNYFHAILGLVIIALAFYQVHYGIVTEWTEGTGDGTVVPRAAMRAWEALIVLFWVLYAAGLALLPRQYKQEAEGRNRVAEMQKA
ncbi:uncharacterized protein FOMMEDRAFT_143304 [Fomitiporia mediterranea MF3/22]|uniref:uncharacterized protein n=1 Tax=Fomitiporia mediterranea (strain MF3/22) TaxID=694068 RepID=UPI0004407CAB|nr:uncharacterized protein FOMMEDRAFT_143304 [Fomitiporia mediterranea MF3/22]EJC98208.1 hypothetical protein FOMMEDRAFT_143304 [Fomitiporia mediterranea MF3/22]